MKTYSEYIWLKRQLAEMQEVLSQNIDSPLMRVSLEKRIASLQAELDSIGSIDYFDTSLHTIHRYGHRQTEDASCRLLCVHPHLRHCNNRQMLSAKP